MSRAKAQLVPEVEEVGESRRIEMTQMSSQRRLSVAKVAAAISRHKHEIVFKRVHCIVFRVCDGLGGLAQLGERVLCKHEVIGSSPIFSIIRADSSAG